jgi:long-chain acyl-CoA synthetase
MSEMRNMVELFTDRVKKYADKTYYMFKKDGEWQQLSYAEFAQKVYAMAAAFEALGVKKGDKIAMLSENRLEWAITDYALLHLGAADVPVYPTLLENQIDYIVNNCDAKIILISNELQAGKIRAIKDKLTKIEHFISYDEVGDDFQSFWKLLDAQAGKNPDYSDNGKNIAPDDLATLIYTSGTTGFPKGVMLTHNNFYTNVRDALLGMPISHEDVFLSFLPLSHSFERMAGHYLPLWVGASIAYAEGIDYVPQNMAEIHPTVMTSVPRLYEKMHARVLDSVEQGPALKQKIFHWSIAQGKQALELQKRDKPVTGFLKTKLKIADKLVFSKLKERLGGRLRYFVSGGAPLSREIGEFFACAQIIILEGYGLTETTPVITVNKADKFKFGTVGPAIKNVELKIAEDGEILARGPNIMLGYYKNEEATKEAIDADNWFHTGDIGYLDEDNYLVITDRKKNIIVTSGGKNIAPQPIENLLVTSKYIEQSIVLGDKRKFCTALIVANVENLEAWAEKNDVSIDADGKWLENDKVKALYRTEIDRLCVDLASYETIKSFALLYKPFSIEEGTLTPTLKTKRKVIEEKYESTIDKLYS